MMAAQEAPQAWHDIVCGTLKTNSVAAERDPMLITDRFMRGLGTKE
jgi:hypothetical protein